MVPHRLRKMRTQNGRRGYLRKYLHTVHTADLWGAHTYNFGVFFGFFPVFFGCYSFFMSFSSGIWALKCRFNVSFVSFQTFKKKYLNYFLVCAAYLVWCVFVTKYSYVSLWFTVSLTYFGHFYHWCYFLVHQACCNKTVNCILHSVT